MMLELSRIDCLGDALRDALQTYKTRSALFEADRNRETARFSYQELLREAERVTTRLQEAGVEAGDRVAILMSNQSRWVMSSHGVAFAGAVLVPLDYKLTAKEQLALIAHADLQAGHLVRVLPSYIVPTRSLYMRLRRARHLPSKVAAFRDFVKTYISTLSL